ncbi:MAG: hypothetical protein WCO66_03295 [Candidatus Absconditabacteria bacterium]
MLSSQEFARLQNLSCLSLSPQETAKLGGQLSSIVGFLGTLANLHVDQDILEQGLAPAWDHGLSPVSGVVDYEATDALFINTQHEIINRSIVIKSVVE